MTLGRRLRRLETHQAPRGVDADALAEWKYQTMNYEGFFELLIERFTECPPDEYPQLYPELQPGYTSPVGPPPWRSREREALERVLTRHGMTGSLDYFRGLWVEADAAGG